MTNAATIIFAQSYHSALLKHLSTDSSTEGSTIPTARELGREAAEAGMGLLDVVRTHDYAMSAITEKNEKKQSAPMRQISPGGAFLLESLSLIDGRLTRAHQNIRETEIKFEKQLKLETEQYSVLLAKSKRMQLQSQKLAHQIIMAQEEERREISRELHDEVAQILAGINVRLAVLREEGAMSNHNLELSILQTQKMIEESVNVVHRFARKLRPSMLDDLGLIPTLNAFIKELDCPSDLEIKFTSSKEIEKMDNTQRTVVYRVAQESLLNVVRHAEAKNVTLNLKTTKEGIRLEVHDDGKGFQSERIFISKEYQRLGLLGMKERVEMVGGTFVIESVIDKGTTIRADIPFEACFRKQIE